MRDMVNGLVPIREIDEIAEKAESAAQLIIDEALSDKKALESATKAYIERIRAEYGRKLYEDIEELRRKSQERTDLEVASEIDGVHGDIMRRLKEDFLKQVLEADMAAKRLWLSSILKTVTADLGTGLLHVREEDSDVAAGYVSFEVRTDLKASGGLIAESGDRTLLLDCTLEAVAEGVWNSRRMEICEMLFG